MMDDLAVKRIFDMAEAGKVGCWISPRPSTTRASPARQESAGRSGVHNMLRSEVYLGTLVWGISGKAEPVRVGNAFPAIVRKAQFRRVKRLMRSRDPRGLTARRVGSTHMLSGLVKCRACTRAFSGQDAKSGQFSCYVCQSIAKDGKDACDAPRINARRFEEMVVGSISSNILTEGNIRT